MPSPEPLEIIELPAIRTLLDSGTLVIAVIVSIKGTPFFNSSDTLEEKRYIADCTDSGSSRRRVRTMTNW